MFSGPLLLAAAVALFYWPVLFGGQSFWFRDTMSYYYPEAVLTARSLGHGRVPLWEPSIGLGYPYHADPHSMAFYPPALLLTLGEFPRIYALFTVLHVWLGAAGMFTLLARWGLRGPAAGLGAGVLAFSGFTVSVTSLTTLLRGLAWGPWVWWAFDRFATSGRWPAAALAGALLAMQGSGTDPQYVLFTAAVMALLPLIRPAEAAIRAATWARGVVVAVAVAGVLLAVQYVPLAELAWISGRLDAVSLDESLTYAVDPSEIAYAVVPIPYPNPARAEYFGGHRGMKGPFYPDLYWGLPVLALAFAGLARAAGGGRFGPGLALGAIASLSALLAMGDATPLFRPLHAAVPLVGMFRFPAKYMLLAAWAIPMLAALGFEGVLAGASGCRRAFAVAVMAGAAAAVAAGCWLAATGLRLPRSFLGIPQEGSHPLTPLAETLASGWAGALAVTVALAAACWLAIRGAPGAAGSTSPRLLGLGALAVAQLALAAWRGVPMAPDAQVAGTVPASVAALPPVAAGPPPRFISYRPRSIVMAPGGTLFDHFQTDGELLTSLRGTLWGVNSLNCGLSIPAPAERRLEALLLAALPEARDELARAAGAEAAIRVSAGEGGAAGAAPGGDAAGEVPPERRVAVRRLDGATPRVFLAARAIPSAAPGATAAALLALPWEAAYEPAGPGLLQVGPPQGRTGKNPRSEATVALGSSSGASPESREVLSTGAGGACRLTAYGANGLTVDFETVSPALLVVLDGWYPGWRARVDGREAPVLVVAGLFRGVRVSPGERSLEMRYEPASLGIGAAITVAGSCVMLLLVLHAALGARRRPEDTVSIL